MNVIAKRFPVHGFQCDLFFSPSVSVKLDKCNEAQDAFCCLRHVKVNLLKLSKTSIWGYLEKIRRKQFLKSESGVVSPLINCNQQAALPPVSLKGSSYSSSYLFSYLIIIFRVIIKTLATATGKLSFCVGQRTAQENDSFEAVTALTAPA